MGLLGATNRSKSLAPTKNIEIQRETLVSQAFEKYKNANARAKIYRYQRYMVAAQPHGVGRLYNTIDRDVFSQVS